MTQPLSDSEYPELELERQFHSLARQADWFKFALIEYREIMANYQDETKDKLDKLRHVAELQTNHGQVLREAVAAIAEGIELLADGLERVTDRVKRLEERQ
jgi:hypothetical protein